MIMNGQEATPIIGNANTGKYVTGELPFTNKNGCE
jgi:hypothetical protein